MGGVIQFVDEGQFLNYFCRSDFVEGLQFAIIWTRKYLNGCRETIFIQTKDFERYNFILPTFGYFYYICRIYLQKSRLLET